MNIIALDKKQFLPWRNVPSSLDARIAEACANTEHLEPNCYGTAFFMLGVLPYDMVIYTGQGLIRAALDRMIQIQAPCDHSLVVSRTVNGILHAGYVKESDGSRISGYHRVGSCSGCLALTSLSEIDTYVGSITRRGICMAKEPLEIPIHHDFFVLNPTDDLSDWAVDIVRRYDPAWWA